MEKVGAAKKATVASVVISVVSVMISMATAAGQLVTKKGDASGISEQIGIAAVAGSIYLFHQMRNWIKKRNEAKRSIEAAAKSGIEFSNIIDKDVKHIEHKIMHVYTPMRIFVIHFRNGIHTDAGLSLHKMTIRHEIQILDSVSRISENYQDTPVPDMFYSMITRVRTEGHYYLDDREDLLKDVGKNQLLYDWLTIYEAKSMLGVEIKNGKSGKIVAILVLHFPVPRTLNRIDIVKIKEFKRVIESIYDRL